VPGNVDAEFVFVFVFMFITQPGRALDLDEKGIEFEWGFVSDGRDSGKFLVFSSKCR
jgi:hypothetical protein